jgi:hypothetical protein
MFDNAESGDLQPALCRMAPQLVTSQQISVNVSTQLFDADQGRWFQSQFHCSMGKEQTVGMLTLVCSATGGEINSGVVYHRDDLKRARKVQLHLRCRFCGTSHLFKFSDARLGPITPEKKTMLPKRTRKRNRGALA